MSKENKYNLVLSIEDKYINEINRIVKEAYKLISDEIADNKIFNSSIKKIICQLIVSALIIKTLFEQKAIAMPDLEYEPKEIFKPGRRPPSTSPSSENFP